MKISELSRASGVPLATVKWYLREGLLPPGRSTAATQAQYDEEHVARLRLVRALVNVGGLSLAAVRSVLEAVDSDAGPAAAVGTAHDALPPRGAASDRPPTRALAAVDHLGWQVDPRSAAMFQLEAALTAVEDVGMPAGPERLSVYGAAALSVAEEDVAGVPATSAADAVRFVVVGTVLYEPVLLALRRLAQQFAFGVREAGESCSRE